MNEFYVIYSLLALVLVLSAAALIICVVLLKRGQGNGVDGNKLKNDISETVRMENGMLTGALNQQSQATRDMNSTFSTFMMNVDRKLDNIKEDNARNLTQVREENVRTLEAVRRDNAEQLEKMRATVDEKLAGTLDQRFTQSFKIVNDRLEEINRTFSELQNLQTGVSDLNRLFKNVKTRGTWGEVSLENLLEQILTPEQYDKQVRLTRGSDEAVDFVVKMPGKGDGEVLLPIDAKFPIEDYARIADAADKADSEGVENACKALAFRVKAEAMSIRDKYIKPPKTTDFAVMYLPTEGLYAEVLRRDGLVEDLQSRLRVVVCGPTTLAALLNSLQIGFRSVAIEKRSTEIGKLLQSFLADFAKFSLLLRQTGDKLAKVQITIADADKRTEIIRKKLDKVSSLTGDADDNAVAATLIEGGNDDDDDDNGGENDEG